MLDLVFGVLEGDRAALTLHFSELIARGFELSLEVLQRDFRLLHVAAVLSVVLLADLALFIKLIDL